MDWQGSPRSSTQLSRKRASGRIGSTDSSDSAEPGEIKKKPARKSARKTEDEKPSTSAAARAKLDAQKRAAELGDNYFAPLSSDDDDFDDVEATVIPSSDSELDVDCAGHKFRKNKLAEKTPKSFKPPPIFIPDVTNIAALISTIENSVGKGKDFTYKAARDNQIRVMMPDKESYSALKSHLDSAGNRYFTFQPKEDRAYRVVVKGLHHTTDIDDIKEDFRRQGHVVRDVRNAVGHISKTPLSIFFVNLEPSSNNKEVFDVKRVCHSVVTVEPPRKFHDVPQCYRCQGFGHSQRYCKLQHRCVKCGDHHSTSECKKKREEAAKCVHCHGAHPASYKGCPAYKKAKVSMAPKEPRPAQPRRLAYPPPQQYPTVDTSARSYADIARGGVRPHHHQTSAPEIPQTDQMAAFMTRVENLLERVLDKMFERMTTMMSSILSQVCSK
ncbi:hypothetical protein KR067_013519 [Drosophila pandora]|nr:hypothetical protein KR067_013519 [Drosophila pandora]